MNLLNSRLSLQKTQRRSKLFQNQSKENPRCKVRFSERYSDVCKAGHRRHWKGRFIAQVERYLDKKEQIHMEKSGLELFFCSVQKMQTLASRISQKTRETREITAVSCCSTRLKVKKEVEALRWLMHFATPMERTIHGLHRKERRRQKRMTSSLRRTRGERHKYTG